MNAVQLPPKQKTIFDAATSLQLKGEPITARSITEIVEPSAFDFSAAMLRTRMTIQALKKKDKWTFGSIAPEKPSKPSKQFLEKALANEDSLSVPQFVQKAPVATPCTLHAADETAIHDFGVKVLEGFSKLSRNAQSELWPCVRDILDKSL